jgi:hypothetical protein
MSAYFKRATEATYVIFLVDSSNRPIGKTSATVSASVSKDGGAFLPIAGSVTEIGSGYYKFLLSASETDAQIFAVKATASGADPWNDIQLTDSVRVSEISTDGLSFMGGGGGDSVWSEKEKKLALEQLAKVLDVVRIIADRVGVVQATVEANSAGMSEISKSISDSAVKSKAELSAEMSGVKSLLDSISNDMPEQFSFMFREHKTALVERLVHAEQVILSRTNSVLVEANSMDDGIARLRKDIDYLVRAMTFTLDTATLERMAAEAPTR